MDSFGAGLILGIILGCSGMLSMVYGDIHLGATNLIEACEKELPRNISCKLVAVPEDGQ